MRGKINFFWKIVFACFLMVLTFGVFDISADAATFSIGGKSYNTDDAMIHDVDETAYYFEDGTLYLKYPDSYGTGLPTVQKDDIERIYYEENNKTDLSSAVFFWSPKEIVFGENFDTSNVTNMSNMFTCRCLEKLDISNFDTSNVTNMSGMFLGCASLKTLDVSNFDTSNVTNMSGMFYDCGSLSSLDLSNFKTSNVANMLGMFEFCYGLRSIKVSDSFNTSKVTDMSSMFYKCENLSDINFFYSFDMSKVEKMDRMFMGCDSIEYVEFPDSFNLSNVTSMSQFFASCKGLKKARIANANLQNVTDMRGLFWTCYELTEADISNVQSKKLEKLGSAFAYCKKLKSINMTNFYAPNLNESVDFFNFCDELKSITAKNVNIGKSIYLGKKMYDANGKEYTYMPEGKVNLVLSATKPPKQSISKFAIKLSKDAYTYDGKAKKPTVSVKGLKLNKDFKVTYSNNTKIGKAKVVIKGIGNYKGSVTKYYTINPRGTSLSKVTCSKKTITVKWKKGDSQVTGYEIQYGTEKKTFTNENSKIVNVKKNATTSAKIKKGLKAKKTYYVRIRTYKTVGGKKYYSGWSTVKKIKVK